MSDSLRAFVAESNRIEGIREVRGAEVAAHQVVLAAPAVTVRMLEAFVWSVANAPIRDKAYMNVRVGKHVPPRGGAHIRSSLDDLLQRLPDLTPHAAHHEYETLHPFMDGNGRSGRALWLWMMQRDGFLSRALALGFLHAWYYQSLDEGRATPHDCSPSGGQTEP